MASLELYSNSRKLVYRFIADRPIVAHDPEGRFTLNSANFLIPDEDLDIPYLLAALNSAYARFYFQKIFKSVKVLKSNLGAIPVPVLEPEDHATVVKLAREIQEGKTSHRRQEQIDRIFCHHFGIELENLKA